MKIRLSSAFFLPVICIFWSLFFGEAFAEPGSGYHLFLQTNAIDRSLGSFISLDAGTYETVDELKDSILKFKGPNGEELRPNSERPVDVNIVVPKGAPQKYIDDYEKAIRSQLAELYPQASYKIHLSYIDTDQTKAVFEEAEHNLEQELENKNRGAEEESLLKQTLEGVKEDKASLISWRDRWYGKTYNAFSNPLNRNTAARAIGFTKGVIPFYVTITKYGLNTASFFIALANFCSTALLGYHATEFSQWSSSFKLLRNRMVPNLHVWLERFPPIRWFNQSTEARSITIGAIRSIGLAYVFRLLAYLNDQKVHKKDGTQVPVESPNSIKFLTEGLGITTWEVMTDAGLDVGARALTQKRYVNYTGRSWILWGISVIDTAGHAAFRTGDTGLAAKIFFLSGLLKLGVYGAGRFAPRKNPQIVIISDLISRGGKGSDFHYVKLQRQLTEAVRQPSEAEIALILDKEILSNHEITELFGLHDVPTALVQEVGRVLQEKRKGYESCMYALSQMLPSKQKNRVSRIVSKIPFFK